jgi:hypothetical protein
LTTPVPFRYDTDGFSGSIAPPHQGESTKQPNKEVEYAKDNVFLDDGFRFFGDGDDGFAQSGSV